MQSRLDQQEGPAMPVDRSDGPTAEQEVEHLAGQCATLLRENERLRAALERITRECNKLNGGPVAVLLASEALKH
jgi:hypothetical protein